MFHLFHYIWHVFVQHRHVWLTSIGLMLILGVGLHTGMQQLDATLTKQYEKVQKTQKPTARELRIIRRRQRLQARRERATFRAAAPGEFPPFLHAVHPVSKIPDWGSMRSPEQWNRSYQQMTAGDFIDVPKYDLQVLTMPMSGLISPLSSVTQPLVTAKLYYSTRYFGKYDIDSTEFTWIHAGVDLKLPMGTPVGAIGGGRVVKVDRNDDHFGIYVMVEHRLPEGTFFSIYGHLASMSVSTGQDVEPGQEIGTIGMTGKTTGPHLHLQIDKGSPGEDHIPVHFEDTPTKSQAEKLTAHPIQFIEKHSKVLTAAKSAL